MNVKATILTMKQQGKDVNEIFGYLNSQGIIIPIMQVRIIYNLEE